MTHAVAGSNRRAMDGSAGHRFELRHRTSYTFDRPVRMSPHEVRLRPAPHANAPIEAYSLDVMPASHTLHWQQDPYANWVARLTFPEPAGALVLEVRLRSCVLDIDPFAFFVDPSAYSYPFSYAPLVRDALQPCLAPLPGESGLLRRWVQDFRATITAGEGTIAMLVRLNRHLRDDVDYSVREAEGVQSPETTLAARVGSCRDSAWLLIAVLRELGLAARFVSGYLVELASDAEARDRASLHAWVEAFVPGAGWVGLDPTSGLLAAGGHIPLACAAHHEMAATVSGTTERAGVIFDASISLVRGAAT